MFIKSIGKLAFCSQAKPILVGVKVELRGKIFSYQFPVNTKLGPNL